MDSRTLPLNVVALRGVLSRPAEERTLPSGARLLLHQVTVDRPDGPADSVPVVWIDPPARTALLDAGDEVVVVGRVRRRFYRSGGAVASATEVVAERVVPARGARATRLLRSAGERLDP